MKRILICASAAIVALASCSETHVVYNEAPTEIGFKKITGAMTKAGPLSDYHTSMGVFAYKSGESGTSYFGNTKFIDRTNYWGGETPQYYPLTGNLDFAYYAPYNEAWTLDKSGTVYTMASPKFETVKNDILYGTLMVLNQARTEENVPVVLGHALAKISIKAKANTPDIVTISQIDVKDVFSSGKFTVTYGAAANTASLTSAVWSDKGTSSNVTVRNQDNKALTTEVAAYGESFYVIPSDLNKTDVLQTSLVIQYKLAGQVADHTLEVDLSGSWEMGKHYVYTLEATAYEIKLTPSVVDMVEENTTVEVKETVALTL